MLRRTLVIIAVAAISAMVVTACNGDDITDDIDPGETADEVADDGVDPEEPDEGAARTDDDGAGQTGGSPADDDADLLSDQLDVTLTDYEIEMDASADEGMITFILNNEGDDQHGITIVQANGNDEDELGMMEVAPGEEEQLELELEAGDYIVYCPVGDHREEHGMETELTVEEVEED